MKQEKEDKAEERNVPKAKWAAAPPGLIGIAYPSAGMEQDLMGRIPSAKARGIVPEPSRGRKNHMNKASFKELLRQDVRCVFLNPAEFGEEHLINKKKMLAVIDDIELTEREKRMQNHMDGIYKKQTLVFVCALDFGPLPGLGKPIVIDGRTFLVADAINEGGVYSLHLEANKN